MGEWKRTDLGQRRLERLRADKPLREDCPCRFGRPPQDTGEGADVVEGQAEVVILCKVCCWAGYGPLAASQERQFGEFTDENAEEPIPYR